MRKGLLVKKGLTIVMTLIVLSALSLVGCKAQNEKQASGPVELRFTVWTGNADHLAMLNGIASKYTQLHPNVTVKFDTIPYGDYTQKLTLQLAGSNPPDAGWITEGDAPAFIDAGVLQDLTSAVSAYDYTDFAPSTTALWNAGQTVYGIPFSTSPILVLYNKTLFNAAGIQTPTELSANQQWTWDAFAEAAKQIKAKTGKYGYVTFDGTGYTENLWPTIVPMIRAYGGDVWSADKTSTIASPQSIAALTLFHTMIYKDRSVVPPGDQTDFFTGSVGMTLTQISRVSKLKDASFEWGLAVLPQGPSGDAQLIGQAGVVAFKAGKHTAEAADFAAFMTNKENVETMTQFFPPARVSVLSSDTFTTGNPMIDAETMKNVVAYALKNGKVLPSNANFPKINLVARASFDAMWHADADVKAVLTKVSDGITPLLK